MNLATTALVVVTVLHASVQFPGVKFEIKEALGVPQSHGLRATLVTGLGLGGLVGNSKVAQLLGTNAAVYETSSPLGTSGALSNYRRSGEYRLESYFEAAAMPELKEALGRALRLELDEFVVLTINLPSSLAIFNGFRVPNGYFADYPVSKGEVFLELFRGEYAKDGLDVPLASSNYLESYVSRKSLAPDEDAVELDVNIEMFYRINGRAVFSYLPISNTQELGLDFIGRYGNIHTYVVLPR